MKIAPVLVGAFLFASVLPAPPALAACSGTYVASAKVAGMTTDASGLDHYAIKVVVSNGGPRQASNVLQSIDVYHFDAKVDKKGVPPLMAGGSYAWTYNFRRNAGAGKGTTTLRFQVSGGGAACASQHYNLSF